MINVSPPSVTFCLANGLTNGGVTTWSLGLCERLGHLGRSSQVLSHTAGATYSLFSPPEQVEIIDCPGNAIAQNVDLIHGFLPSYSQKPSGVFFPNWSWGTWATVALLSLHQQSDIRAIAVAHSDDAHYYEVLSYYDPIISKFIAVSTEIHDHLLELLPHRTADISKALYPVPSAIRPKTLSDRCELTIAYVGRVEQDQKRILDLKDLAFHLSKDQKRYRFIIAGDGHCLPELIAYFNQSDYPNIATEFLGLVGHEAVSAIWNQADVSILFSEYEGMSISMLESMGQGCVPVVTEVSGVSGTIVHGESGFILPIGDTESMAEVLQTLHEDRELLGRLSAACVSHIQKFHSAEDYDCRMIHLIDLAWQSPPARWPVNKSILPPPPPSSPLFTPFHKEVMSRLRKRVWRQR